MTVQTPVELAYYYECSYGDFRLTYHIPIEILEEMVEGGKIARVALRDYPDGIDLDCSPPDFNDFEKRYKFRPPFEPEPLRRAFKTLFSSMEDWDNFRGTGFLAASYLEGLISRVDQSLKDRDVDLPEDLPVPERPTKEEARQAAIEQTQQQELVDFVLKAIPLEEIVSEKPKNIQELSPKMNKGEAAPSIFTRAHKGQRRGTDDR